MRLRVAIIHGRESSVLLTALHLVQISIRLILVMLTLNSEIGLMNGLLPHKAEERALRV